MIKKSLKEIQYSKYYSNVLKMSLVLTFLDYFIIWIYNLSLKSYYERICRA